MEETAGRIPALGRGKATWAGGAGIVPTGTCIDRTEPDQAGNNRGIDRLALGERRMSEPVRLGEIVPTVFNSIMRRACAVEQAEQRRRIFEPAAAHQRRHALKLKRGHSQVSRR